jgi:hypothetical protein
MTTPDPAPNRHSRRRQRGRRRLLAISAVIVLAVLILGIAVAVLAGGGDDGPTRRVATGGDDVPASTVPPTTTTTLVPSPELIKPPATPEAAAATLTRVERALRGDDRDPAKLRVLGWEQQLAYRQLSNHTDWIPATVAALAPDVLPAVQANLDASAALSRPSLTPPQSQLPNWSIVAPLPSETLRAYYAESEQASGIPWAYLAAIHFLETRMGRIRGDSSAGAQGPMQFIPSSWAAYGNGGDVNDNRDAILAAGRYLRAAGGPANMDKAIFAYNHDDGYVAAVKAYAQNMLNDPRAYDGYHQWQVYYRTVDGTVLLPEGYTANGPVGARTLPPA